MTIHYNSCSRVLARCAAGKKVVHHHALVMTPVDSRMTVCLVLLSRDVFPPIGMQLRRLMDVAARLGLAALGGSDIDLLRHSILPATQAPAAGVVDHARHLHRHVLAGNVCSRWLHDVGGSWISRPYGPFDLCSTSFPQVKGQGVCVSDSERGGLLTATLLGCGSYVVVYQVVSCTRLTRLTPTPTM